MGRGVLRDIWKERKGGGGDPSYVDDTSQNLQKMGEILQGASVTKELESGDVCYLILMGCFLCFFLPPFPPEFN